MISPSIIIEGKVPLNGTVQVSGAKDSALKLIVASIFSSSDVVLDNVPNIKPIQELVFVLQEIGAKVDWIGQNRLHLDCTTINTFELPEFSGISRRSSLLLVPALIFRFGKAVLPKINSTTQKPVPINRLLETWEAFGVKVEEDQGYYKFDGSAVRATQVNFKVNTHIGTDNAILCAIFARGETIISNAAEEPEVEDLVAFCNSMGAEIVQKDNKKLVIQGKKHFKGTKFRVQGEKDEVVALCVATILTKGNLTITGTDKNQLLSFLSFLTKIGCNYEFSKDEMRIWHGESPLKSVNVITAAAPGFLTDWQSAATVLMTQAHGESLIHETIYTDNLGYTKDLNRMGAKITLHKPSDVNLDVVISDDSYSELLMGEPLTVAKVVGPTNLKGNKLYIPDLKARGALVLAALAADGKSEIHGFEKIEHIYENFYSKLTDLGAHIDEVNPVDEEFEDEYDGE